MKKNFRIIVTVLTLTMLMNSCSSIYVDSPEVTWISAMDVDPDEEYFTLGSIYSRQDVDGVTYKDSWIYVEHQEYQRYVRTLSDGTKYYTKDIAERIVKYNAETGVVSSVCLDPTCSHSPGSECLFLVPDSATAFVDSIMGDWIYFSYHHHDPENRALGFLTEAYLYNLTTGESVKISDATFENRVINKMGSFCAHGDKLYYIMTKLDYSDTGYVEGGSVDGYEPETKITLWELDFNTKKTAELFEVPFEAGIAAVSNERIYFKEAVGVSSCDHSGNDMKKESNLDFGMMQMCGTYGFKFDYNEQAIKIYDLHTKTAKIIPMEFSFQQCILTNEGILFSTFSTADEEYTKAIDLAARMKLRHEGTAWIYLMDFDGSNPRRIFEKDKLGITVACATENYFYGGVTQIDPENPLENYYYMNSERHVINRKTGEITPIPLLDLVLPE